MKGSNDSHSSGVILRASIISLQCTSHMLKKLRAKDTITWISEWLGGDAYRHYQGLHLSQIWPMLSDPSIELR